jgi:hypothetical protein
MAEIYRSGGEICPPLRKFSAVPVAAEKFRPEATRTASEMGVEPRE